VGFEQVAEVEDRRFVRRRRAAQIDAHETAQRS
jgi:hypothetical protein